MDKKLTEEFKEYANRFVVANFVFADLYDAFSQKYPDIAKQLDDAYKSDDGIEIDRVLELEVKGVAPEVVFLLDHTFEQYRLLGNFCIQNNIEGADLEKLAEETGVRQKMDEIMKKSNGSSILKFTPFS